MIYLDNAATTMRKPPQVVQAVVKALESIGNAGRGAYHASLDASLFITLQNCQFCSFFFHFIQGTQNRVMFQCRCDNMIARIKESFDGKIQAFC